MSNEVISKKYNSYKMTNNQDKKQYLQSAKSTIQAEIKGLDALLTCLSDNMRDNFISAIDLMINCQGRVIVSGMGKSGHIANKIAATLASTGTASFFIHPAEASHGDLGMISKDDVVILLSNSGETKELRDIIYYCKRFAISLIAIVRKESSELGNAADIALILPEVPEASAIKAPTTSTTMMLALGDAIAITLMNAKGFSPSDYGVFHPGGKLGAEFIKVKDLMRKNQDVPLVAENVFLPKTLFEMTSKHLGCTGVVDKSGQLIGVITDGDLRRHISKNFMKLTAKDLMTKNPVVVSEDALAVQAVALMNQKSITSLFVVKSSDQKLVAGILHIHDCLRAGVI